MTRLEAERAACGVAGGRRGGATLRLDEDGGAGHKADAGGRVRKAGLASPIFGRQVSVIEGGDVDLGLEVGLEAQGDELAGEDDGEARQHDVLEVVGVQLDEIPVVERQGAEEDARRDENTRDGRQLDEDEGRGAGAVEVEVQGLGDERGDLDRIVVGGGRANPTVK